jgi:hypothetical protein
MKTRKPEKPAEATVLVLVPLSFELIDRRSSFNGLSLGTIEQCAKQYGVKIKKNKKHGGNEFTAPVSRLQIFVEKLHFAGVPYLEV